MSDESPNNEKREAFIHSAFDSAMQAKDVLRDDRYTAAEKVAIADHLLSTVASAFFLVFPPDNP